MPVFFFFFFFFLGGGGVGGGERWREREKRWVARLCVLIIIIIHKFSIALFPAERAQRACSHTCT